MRDNKSIDSWAGEFVLKRKLIFVLVILSVLFARRAFAGNYADGVAKRSVCDMICDKGNMFDTCMAQNNRFQIHLHTDLI